MEVHEMTDEELDEIESAMVALIMPYIAAALIFGFVVGLGTGLLLGWLLL